MSRPDRARIVSMLQGSSLLGKIPEPDLIELAGRVRAARYRAGDLIFAKGCRGDNAVIVLSGRVKIVSVSPQTGTEVILNLIDPGQIFGEMSMLDGEPRSADAVALVPTETVSLGRRDFLAVLRDNPQAMEDILMILCARLRQTSAFVEGTALLDAGARLLERLMSLANRYGKPVGQGGIRIEHGLSQAALGESVGLTRVSINRHLAAWKQEGLLDHGRGWILVHDMEAFSEAVLPGVRLRSSR